MEKDKRYNITRHLIETGYVRSFGAIFDTIPRAVIAKAIGWNNKRFNRCSDSVGEFKVEDLVSIANLFEIDPAIILALVLAQLQVDTEKRGAIHQQR